MNRPEIYNRFGLLLSPHGYYRQPALWEDQLYFISEDDLWTVSLSGGIARRLTAAAGQVSSPVVSPDGQLLAFTSTEQGCPEVFVMASRGGPAQKLTFSGAKAAQVVAFSADGQYVIFRSNLQEPFSRQMALYQVPVIGGEVRRMDIGPASSICYAPDKRGRALARFRDDLARWKGYRGGAAGQIWVDEAGDGRWRQILEQTPAGLCRPMWIGERLYFISDMEGGGNIHSCTLSGEDLRRHTDFQGFYARFASHFGAQIVFSRGGALFRLDTATDKLFEIAIEYASPGDALKERFVNAADYLEDYNLHPKGHSLVATTRGKAFYFANWEGAARQAGQSQGVRYRLATYLNDGKRILVVSDEGGEERFELYSVDGDEAPRIINTEDVDPGRPIELAVSPVDDAIVFTNHRHELIYLDLELGECFILDKSPYDRIGGVAFSPDGRWVAYSFYNSFSTSLIKLVDLDEGKPFAATTGEFQDVQPIFDPAGRYLYFLSYRHFDPVYDQLFLELSFPRGIKPCVITLSATEDSPFVERARPLEDLYDDEEAEQEDEESTDGAVQIDREGIFDRIEVFPVDEGNYGDLGATADRVFWSLFPLSGAIDEAEDETPGVLEYFDLKKKKVERFAEEVISFVVEPRGQAVALYDGVDLWVSSASGEGIEESSSPGRESGLIDLDRLSVAIDPRAEYAQMLRESWRLMRDHFWREDMGGLDWDEVWERYKELLPRVSTRGEFSDLVWTMQGELGTSHAFESGGDYGRTPQYQPGFLGAEIQWDSQWQRQGKEAKGAYRFASILRGDPWDRRQSSPLLRPGLNVKEGDVLLAINGRPLSKQVTPGKLLSNQARNRVDLLVAAGDGKSAPRKITVQTLKDETALRYREWVIGNRRAVHAASKEQIGYIHIPDMGPAGYAEFHRQFLSEYQKPGLIVDVRQNEGGYVSPLILEKLARRPLGFELQRWGASMAYPAESVAGPIVALADEGAGSDGDVFSHSFKLMKLGPLVGTRTWGGTIGIHPRHELVDGSVTTQPEFSSWFQDVGFTLENWGTEPDIEALSPPQSGSGEQDPQLCAAIKAALDLLSESDLLEPPEF